MQDCKDCIQIKKLEDKIASIWHVLNELKTLVKDYEKRITELEIAKGEDRKDLKNLFESIEEIKKSISKIATSLELMQGKSAKTFENLKYEVIKYLVIAVVAAAVVKIM